MQKIWTIIEVCIAAIGAGLGFFFGQFNGFFIALLVLMVVDVITGFIAAAINKELSSKVSFKGILKKVLILFIVGVANILDSFILPDNPMLRTAVIFFYFANEGLSILENIGKAGVPIPSKVLDILAELKTRSESENDDQGNGIGAYYLNGSKPGTNGTSQDDASDD